VGALGDRAADDGRRRCGEHHLIEEEGEAAATEALQEEVAGAEPAARIEAEQKAVADRPEHRGAEAHVQEVLHQHVHVVLGARQPAFEKGEPGLHEEHERAGQAQNDDIDQGQFAARLRTAGGAAGRQSGFGRHEYGRREQCVGLAHGLPRSVVARATASRRNARRSLPG